MHNLTPSHKKYLQNSNEVPDFRGNYKFLTSKGFFNLAYRILVEIAFRSTIESSNEH